MSHIKIFYHLKFPLRRTCSLVSDLAALSLFTRQAVRLKWHLTNQDTVLMSRFLHLFENIWSFCETSKCFLWHASPAK